MEYRLLGRTGIRISPLGLGTDNFANPTSPEESTQLLLEALDAGINLVDTSNSYGQGESEKIIGHALKQHHRRQQVILATKAYYPVGMHVNDQGNNRRHLIQACEDSLKRLHTDYIDLYQLHRPDDVTHPEETLYALDTLVRQGKVRYVGTSTHPAWKIMESLGISESNHWVRFVSEQSPYNLLDRRIENELIPMAQAHQIALITWSPLAMGLLAGRYPQPKKRPADSRAVIRGSIYADRVTDKAIEASLSFVVLAKAKGWDPAQLAVCWVKDQPGITAPLIGPRTIEQLHQMIPVMEMNLPEPLREACDKLVAPGSAIANFHNSAAWMKWQF
ncbi:MAG TPA: aldo/keto reductase [Saprospiraceae bacterium]|nr:aldo/keto reductase [Saprospiraceae bacterium]HPG09590.1 aldo/keto reductase [Saprospiraceae bacterium]HRV87224.1 aldo/keto reductase [Saprospiraceae bacterium]